MMSEEIMVPRYGSGEGRVFSLHGQTYKVVNDNVSFGGAVILTTQPVTFQTIQNAWTYAVRYSAKGLDHPDYEAALKLMLSRHPSWQIIDKHCPSIQFDLKSAGEDIPEA